MNYNEDMIITTNTETYNGWANRETWAFWLHVTNDEGWYNSVREYVELQLDSGPDPDEQASDYYLGEQVVEYVKETLDNKMMQSTFNRSSAAEQRRMMRDEIGSWWRIDYAEIGAAARELVTA